jgi:hypothetical protein
MDRSGKIATRIAAAAALVALLAFAPAALAGKGGTHGNSGGTPTTGTTLSLSSETVKLNPNWPSSCLSEDDYDKRVFSGSLAGSFSTSYQTCDLNTDGFTAGGIGLEADVYVVGQLSDLSIIAPDGGVTHAVLMDQTTSRGVTTSHYAVCNVPRYFMSDDTGTDPLPGGSWQMALSGRASSVTFTTRAQMTDVVFQQTYCPASQQNLSP